VFATSEVAEQNRPFRPLVHPTPFAPLDPVLRIDGATPAVTGDGGDGDGGGGEGEGDGEGG
jgi:hypothetical protein